MGIYDRNYYRDLPRGGGWWDSIPRAVRGILVCNIVVFLLQLFLTREHRAIPLEGFRRTNPEINRLLTGVEQGDESALQELKERHPELYDAYLRDERGHDPLMFAVPKESIVQQWFELDTNKVIYRGHVWRLITHAFCHDRYSIFHIIFNMLLFYWFGCTLESMYGTREFLLFYLSAALAAAGAKIALDLYLGTSVPAIGASGAVMGVLMLYAWHFPRETIIVCWVLPLEIRWFVALCIIIDVHPVLLSLSGDQMHTGVANAAHLGGLAFGFLYAKFGWRISGILDRVPRVSSRRLTGPRLKIMREPVEERIDPAADRIDDLLRKISESGQTSLTEEEREILRRASERLRNRGRE